jgi:hypothetical protein
LVLGQASGGFGSLHSFTGALVGVANIAEAQGTAAILIAGEFGCYMLVDILKHFEPEQLTDSRLRVCLLLKLDDAGATRAAIGLILDLSALDLANGGEEFNQIFIAGRPRKLGQSEVSVQRENELTLRT